MKEVLSTSLNSIDIYKLSLSSTVWNMQIDDQLLQSLETSYMVLSSAHDASLSAEERLDGILIFAHTV